MMNRNRAKPQRYLSDIHQPNLPEQVCQAARLQEVVYRLRQIGVRRPVSGDYLAHQGNQPVEIKPEKLGLDHFGYSINVEQSRWLRMKRPWREPGPSHILEGRQSRSNSCDVRAEVVKFVVPDKAGI